MVSFRPSPSHESETCPGEFRERGASSQRQLRAVVCNVGLGLGEIQAIFVRADLFQFCLIFFCISKCGVLIFPPFLSPKR